MLSLLRRTAFSFSGQSALHCLSIYQALFSRTLLWFTLQNKTLKEEGACQETKEEEWFFFFSSMILYFLHPNGSVHLDLSGWLPKQVWSSSKVSQEPGNQFQCAEGLSRACFCPAVFIEHPEPDFWNSGRLTFQIKERFGYPPTEPLKKKKKDTIWRNFPPKEKYSSLSVMLSFSFLFLPSFSVVFERTLPQIVFLSSV